MDRQTALQMARQEEQAALQYEASGDIAEAAAALIHAEQYRLIAQDRANQQAEARFTIRAR